ncbi:MAG: recombinase family protein, partial [Anaerolineales bacterium]|nr:recombinase family protein [Anaerolineales bacterium]
MRLTLRLYATGAASYGDVADTLNRSGYRPRGRASRFTKTTARDLLQNHFYLGLTKLRKLPGYERYEYGPGRHPALIDAAVWEAIEQVRATHARRPMSRKRADRVYPLTGLAICADCGRTLRGQSSRHSVCYRDPASRRHTAGTSALIRADDIEAQVIDWLSAWPLPAFLHLDEPDRDPSDGAHQEPAKVRAQLERQLARLARLFQWGDLSATAYRR